MVFIACYMAWKILGEIRSSYSPDVLHLPLPSQYENPYQTYIIYIIYSPKLKL